MFQSAKQRSVGDMKSYPLSPLTLGREIQNLEFALLDFKFALVQCFINKFLFIPFEMVMYILCHCMVILEVCDQHFDF